MSLSDGITGPGFAKFYSRTLGVIQVLYAAFLGRPAFLCLRWTTQQMTWIVQKGFDFRGTTFKGVYLPALDLENLLEGTVFALLSLCCLIGGFGLLQLRSWARRWAVVYLIAVSIYSLWVLAAEVGRGHDFGYIVLFSLALTLPYLLLFVISPPPEKITRLGKATGTKPVVDDLGGL